jgi:hypothetical protein
MALNVWTQQSGYSFGSFVERITVDLPLPVTNDTGVTYSIISGALPGGLRIQGNKIVGTPYEVSRNTDYSFCIRAFFNGSISDRTFKISILSINGPEFITSEGELPIGPAQQLWTLDSSYIDFQIEVDDQNLSQTQRLSFFIASDDGVLPPGLVLTPDGRIVGFVQPVLSIKPEDGSGTYDGSRYDAVSFDFAFRPTNGYDSYIYDTVFFDFNIPNTPPKKLNRNYEFIVSVTDGDVTVQRKFAIFVVGDDYFRADNTYLSGEYTSDVTYLRKPVWLTPSYLGVYRANNYVTIPLQTYDTENIINTLLTVNSDNSPSVLPPGMQYDVATSEIYGAIPYQPAVTKTYKFTITSTRFSDKDETASSSRTFTIDVIGEIDSIITWNTPSDLGSINANYVSNLNVVATSTISQAMLLYHVTAGSLPPGLSLDLNGEIVGKVNQYAVIQYYNVNDILDGGTALSVFTQTVEGGDAFNTGYPIDGGSNDILISPGLTRFYDLIDGERVFTTFDNDETTIDRIYTFTVEARDQFGVSAVSRTFSLLVNTPNQLMYSNIKVKPFLKVEQRTVWKDFINDTNVFTPSSIYRTNDPEFGLQTSLSMIMYAGIETTQAAAYVGAVGLNHKRKRFQFGSVKTAVAYIPGTTTPVYEVVYVEILDPLEPDGKRLPSKLNLQTQNTTIKTDSSLDFWSTDISKMSIAGPDTGRPEPIITVDSQGYYSSNSNPSTYFPNSSSIWRERISSIGASERNYLPLWMRSIQPGTRSELGFKLAVPLCYCKVGTSADILLNIKYSGFDFKQLDYTVDRYIIDAVEGDATDKYLVFRNDRITI